MIGHSNGKLQARQDVVPTSLIELFDFAFWQDQKPSPQNADF
jgi:hypothetical protein